MTAWKKNFVFIWISQFFSLMGFACCLPFGAYFIQELGVTDPAQLNWWVALYGAATPLGMAVAQPFWGAAADRYGRRRMLLRANLAGMLVLLGMGFSVNVYMLILFRLFQGCFTGTMTAAAAMVSVQTPENRNGFALGALSSGVFTGAMAGAAVGGLMAGVWGYRAVFLAAAVLLGAGYLLILFGTQESVTPASTTPAEQSASSPVRRAAPILILISVLACVRQFDLPFLPLLVQEIHGGLEGVARWTGALFAVGSIGGLLAGLIFGRFSDRINPARLLPAVCAGAALFVFPQGLAQGFALLFASRFFSMLCTGAMDPLLQIWLARITPSSHRGRLFGWAATARAVGWLVAPLIAGAIATASGVRAVFFTGALLFLFIIPLIRRTRVRS